MRRDGLRPWKSPTDEQNHEEKRDQGRIKTLLGTTEEGWGLINKMFMGPQVFVVHVSTKRFAFTTLSPAPNAFLNVVKVRIRLDVRPHGV